MATSQGYIDFVCEQLCGIGTVRYKKMFGEYMVYLNDKPIFLVCNSTVYVKKLEAVASLLSEAEMGVPYHNAKEHYILDIEDSVLAQNVALALEVVVPVPKPRKKKSK